MECGARFGPLPPAVAKSLLHRDRDEQVLADEPTDKPAAGLAFMPTPRAAAIAVMSMLLFGVFLGAGTNQLAQSAGLSAIVLEMASSPPLAASGPVESAPTAAPSAGAEAAPLLPATTSSVPSAPAQIEEESTPEAPVEPTAPAELPEDEALPPVTHVFLIVLGENGFEETFGEASSAPYLAKTLRAKGELISNYYAVTKGDLANQVAILSGQGPTAEIGANCPNYTDITPGTVSATGQVEGAGCVYAADTPTLPGQLVEKKMKWKAYIEDIGNGAATGAPATCRHPVLGGPDSSPAPQPGDAYVTWRNPFAYFHSLTDGAECAKTDVGLDQLAPDLKTATKTPTLSYIVPNACHDGGELPCEPGQPAGPLAAEAFLQTVVPEIEASAAYKEGGLIAITSAEAPQAGPKVDTSACCIFPVYPNLSPEAPAEPVAGVKPTGGGKVGLLLLSPFVAPGTGNETSYYNHFSLLFSIEELLGLERIGYAAEEALTAFDSSIYNAETSEVAAPPRKARASRLLRTLLPGIK
jgi:hypothetical protein